MRNSQVEGVFSIPELGAKEFELFRRLIHDYAGIDLQESKIPLVKSRLAKRLRLLGLHQWHEYASYLSSGHSKEERQRFINALTTNKTEFFREREHFNILSDHIKSNLRRSSQDTLYIWSAAASRGHEAYTAAMVLEHIKRSHGYTFNYKILGTDINSEVLEVAQDAVYPRQELDSVLQQPQMASFLLKGNGKYDGLFKVAPSIAKNVKFRPFNLTASEARLPLKFDYIFLRNVLIYFSRPTVISVLSKVREHLRSGGVLFLGNSEGVSDLCEGFEYLGMSTYRRTKS